jgi:hypothetical protein
MHLEFATTTDQLPNSGRFYLRSGIGFGTGRSREPTIVAPAVGGIFKVNETAVLA